MPAPNVPTVSLQEDPRIEDYLDQVCAPLVGVVPYARRQELRAELREHLTAMAAAQQELGSGQEAAIVMALRQFGNPRDIAADWAREWLDSSTPDGARSPWRTMGIALCSFGLATLVSFALFLFAMALVPMPRLLQPIIFMLSTGGVAFAFPLITGLSVGWLAPARRVLGTFYALAVILPFVALIQSNQMGPADNLSNYVTDWGILVLLFWLPVGCGGAALGGLLRQRRRPKPRQWVLQ
jgi:hypothetical protein